MALQLSQPVALSVILVVFACALGAVYRPKRHSSAGLTPIPVYGPWYIPSFLRGICAMYLMSASEDAFLRSLYETYGPLVYIPHPFNQYLALSSSLIQAVYATPSSKLSFMPIRTGYQSTVFGTAREIASSEKLPKLFPLHAKALGPNKLDEPMKRFTHIAKQHISQLAQRVDDAEKGSLEIDLVEWIVELMFECASAALFGYDFHARSLADRERNIAGLRAPFDKFDDAFGLLASGKIPTFLQNLVPPIKDAFTSRDIILDLLERWTIDGMPGVGEDDIIHIMGTTALNDGVPPRDVATIIFGELWALQANAPYIAIMMLLYIIQSPPNILDNVLKEIDSLPRSTADNSDLEETSFPDPTNKELDRMVLTQSCLQETIRLNTSSYSIRIAQEDHVLSFQPDSFESGLGTTETSYFIPKDAAVICLTRLPHLIHPIWGGDAEKWDGERFMPGCRPISGETSLDKEQVRIRRIKTMRGFGGGNSICEGRHLATSELKTIISLLLSTFEIQPLHVISQDGKAILPLEQAGLHIYGGNGKEMGPKRLEGRPGLGAFQFAESDVRVKISRRRH